ncbi:hypothetical protein [Steroidobacter sp.]|uniref:hypothetical protein n=1 Tax=Steroidobacter sp. TaxID=1978227 RepID=UPI001A490767|nr:hypothetical protein [Steroidobacter sp.]MBL8265587.1 hypothetical protein [Steroidobacter sp.]
MPPESTVSAEESDKALGELSDLLHKARELKQQFGRLQHDRELVRANSAVYYVIDSDVVTDITAPSRVHRNDLPENGWRKRPAATRHYLKNLVWDDWRAQQAFGYILGEYFSRRRIKSRFAPFLLLEPNEVELGSIWNVVYQSAKREQSSLEQEYEQVHALLSSERGITQLQQKQIEELVQKLDKCIREGPLVELHRIALLQEAQNILPADRIVMNGSALLPVPDAAGQSAIANFEKHWLKHLNQQRTAKPRVGAAPGDRWPTNNDIDAAVLARVEWINAQFESAVKDKSLAQRLCLVTGDNTVEYVASRRWFDREETFEQRYLRSPGCFLADPEFFECAGVETPQFLAKFPEETLGQGAGRSFAHWLMMAFTKADKPPLAREEQVAVAARQARLEWATYLRNVANIERLVEFDRRVQRQDDQTKSAVRLGNEQTRTLLSQLRQKMRGLSQAAMSRFTAAGLLAGFLSIDRATHRWPSRVIPVIKFEALPKTRQFVRQLQQTASLDNAQAQLDHGAITALEDLEDGTGYTRYMVFAVAFAMAGEWRSAYTVASAAYSVAETLDRRKWPTSSVKGDEAAYLCAVCRLLSATRVEDLYESEHFLSIARERQLAQPRPLSLQQLAEPLAYRDPRFEAAELIVKISRLHFQEFMPREPAGSADLREHLSAYRAQPLKELCERHLQVLSTVDAESDEDIRSAMKQQLAMSFLQVQLLAKLRNDAASLMPELAVRMIELLRCTPMSTPMPTLVRLVFLCAGALFLPPAATAAEQERRRQELKEVAREFVEAPVMPYDVLRAAKWLKLAEAALNAPLYVEGYLQA